MTQPHGFATQFLDREAPDDYIAEWTAHVAAPKAVVEAGTESVVIFRIHREWLALSTEVFQEVVDQCPVRTLPHHRSGILRGLVSIRGELLLCVALEVLLGLGNATEVRPAKARISPPRGLIIKHGDSRFAFEVSEVYGVHLYHPKDLRNAPVTLAKAAAGTYTTGILSWQDRAVGCLYHELLFYALNKGLA